MTGITQKHVGTKGSHSVWKHYLKKFCSEKGALFVTDLHSNKQYSSSINNAAKENHIYTITEKISKDDVDAFKYIFKINVKGNDEDFLFHLTCFLNNQPELTLKDNIVSEFIQKNIKKDNDINYQRNQEKLFSYYEDSFMPAYEMLINKNSEFYNSLFLTDVDLELAILAAIEQKTSMFLLKSIYTQLIKDISLNKEDVLDLKSELCDFQKKMDTFFADMYEFCNNKFFNIYYFLTFILSQYFRTENRIRILDELAEYHAQKNPDANYNIKSLAALFIHFQTQNMAKKFVQSKHKIIFVCNETEKLFFTSDCPIVNTRSVDDNIIELYYPLTPRLGMLFSNDTPYKDITELNADIEKVNQLNKLMIKSGGRRIYSSRYVCSEDLNV